MTVLLILLAVIGSLAVVTFAVALTIREAWIDRRRRRARPGFIDFLPTTDNNSHRPER